MKFRLTNKESIRSVTEPGINARIDKRIEENIRRYTYEGHYEISERIKELEEEWDIERILHLNVGLVAIGALSLSFKSRHWVFLSAAALSVLIFHAIKGWSPPIPLLRRLGLRTKQEIECEIYAMKFLRGDFTTLQFEGKRDANLAIKEALIAVG